MKIRHADLAIDEKNPFATCQLGRKHYADALTSIVSTYADGFVLAINNEWGTGKTTFVKMWRQSLENNKFKTLYFNAWEHDFDHDPIVAVLSELKSLTRKDSPTFDKILNKAGTLSKHLIPILVRAVADKYIDTKGISEAFEKLSEGAIDILDSEIKEYSQKKETLQAFKTELEEFVREQCGGKPLVFIIDELDRCRPNYAVEVLEKVKHFFSVPGIVFVLSIDKEQLGHAVRGVYGSAEMKADEYLRRFIDLEFVLPKPDVENFCHYLFKYFDFRSFFEVNHHFNQSPPDHRAFVRFAALLFEAANASLRQQEKMFAFARAILGSLGETYSTHPYLVLILIYIRSIQPKLYNQIKEQKLTAQELVDKFGEMIQSAVAENRDFNFPYIEAEICYLYDRSFRKSVRSASPSISGDIFRVTPHFDTSEDFKEYKEHLKNIESDYRISRFSMAALIKKIDMTEALELHVKMK